MTGARAACKPKRFALCGAMASFPTPALPMNLALVGTSRCDVRAREVAGGTVAPLHAPRTAQRAISTEFRGIMREIFRGSLSPRERVRVRGNGAMHELAYPIIQELSSSRRILRQ